MINPDKLPKLGYIDEAEIFENKLMPTQLQCKYIDTLDLGINLEGTHFVIVAGVSTTGKDSLVLKALGDVQNYKYIPRSTSRQARQGELDKVHYFFSFTDAIFWSWYGGNYYGITLEAFRMLKQVKSAISIHGLVYLEFLKRLIEKHNGRVALVYVLPEKIERGYAGSIKVVRERLPIRHGEVMELRLNSIEAELKFVFENIEYMKKRGYQIIENYPVEQRNNSEAVSSLTKILDN